MNKVEAPRTPAQIWTGAAGLFLVALGVLSLILTGPNFGAVTNTSGQDFLLWTVSGWLTILWMAVGAIGLLMASRVDGARSWAMFSGVLFAAMAVWGFIDGTRVAGIFAADTADNITHAALAIVGLAVGLLPERHQREAGIGHSGQTHHESSRFARSPNGRTSERVEAGIGSRG
jgi:hypothetical protein